MGNPALPDVIDKNRMHAAKQRNSRTDRVPYLTSPPTRRNDVPAKVSDGRLDAMESTPANGISSFLTTNGIIPNVSHVHGTVGVESPMSSGASQKSTVWSSRPQNEPSFVILGGV